MTHELVFLRDQPQHLKTVAVWIHRQWWSETDTPPEAIERWLSTHLGEAGFPTTLLVVSDGQLTGSVSLHETEAEDRPAYRPYVGALFVKPGSRRQGFGEALVRAIETHARRLGHSAIYLNANDSMTGFYDALGWRIIERGYGRKQLNIMRRELA